MIWKPDMLKGLGPIGDVSKMLQAAQEMQQKMARVQEDMEKLQIEGRAGAGLVTAICTGKGELKSLNIDPTIFNADDKEIVEDLILTAIRSAQTQAAQKAREEMNRITMSMGLPADMKLPF